MEALKESVSSSIKKNYLRDYLIIDILFSFILSVLYFDNCYISIIFFPLIILFYPLYFQVKLDEVRVKERELFKDALYVISGSIAAGRQMPRAIEDAMFECELLDGNSEITKMFQNIASLYEGTNAKIEDLLCSYAERLEIDELEFFALSYKACSECGGDLERVCLKSASMIIERLEYKKEVSAELSEKKLDILILMMMPILLLFLLNLNSKDFLMPLYLTVKGRIVMIISLLLIVMATMWSLKIMKLDY